MPQLVSKPLPWFKTNPQVRKSFDEAELSRLGESLKVRQLQPVLCQPDGTLIAGERRYRAAKLVGLATLEVKIADETLSEPEVRRWQLVENMQRSDLKAIEQVDGLEELARLNPGMSNKELAELLHIDPSMVTRLRSVARCIPTVRNALSAGTIGISDAYALSKCSTQEEQAALLSLKLAGASRNSIEQAGRKTRKGTVTAVKMSRVKIAMPKGATVVVSGDELCMAEVVELLAETLKEARKAADQYDVKTWVSMMKDKANSA